MEPQLPKPQIGPESLPAREAVPSTGESFNVPAPSEGLRAPIEQGAETKEVRADSPSGDPVSAPPIAPPPVPVVAQPSLTDDSQISGVATPAAAGDDDLIEKEWVDRAKQIVAKTRDDPRAQDEAIGRLQADYLKKRYGKIISSNDG